MSSESQPETLVDTLSRISTLVPFAGQVTTLKIRQYCFDEYTQTPIDPEHLDPRKKQGPGDLSTLRFSGDQHTL